MATKLSEIQGLLLLQTFEGASPGTTAESVGPNAVAFEFATKTYKNPAGEFRARMKILVSLGGRAVHFIIPNAYRLDGKHDSAILRHMAILHYDPSFRGRFGLDLRDNEVSLIVSLLLEDAELTSKQLMAHINMLHGLLENSWEALSHTRETGVIKKPDEKEEKTLILERLAEAVPAELLEKAAKLARDKENSLLKKAEAPLSTS